MKLWQVRYFFKKLPETIAIKVAWRMPKSVAMWCAIRLAAHATSGKYGMESPTDLKFMDALKRWETPN